MANNDRVLSMLGLAAKAGKIASGEFSTEKAVKLFQARMIIVAEDASDNTRKMFEDMSRFYEVPMRVYGTKESLGQCIGKTYRASIAILDDGFARSVEKKLNMMMEV